MKLSQIRNLSWGVALGCATLSGVLIVGAIHSVNSAVAKKPPKWTAPDVNYEEVLDAQKLTAAELKKALFYLTKRAPPPKIELPPTIPAETQKVETPIVTNMDLMLIVWNDPPSSRYTAFIKNNQFVHPYFVGDEIENTQVRVIEIQRDFVMVEDAQGQKAKLLLKYDTSSIASLGTLIPSAQIVSVPGEDTITASPGTPPPPGAKDIRTVPKTRRATWDPDYEIHVVEYEPGESDVQRWAISPKDQKTLENMKFRLMGEVSPNIAYDEAGKAYGIKVSFAVDKPLLAKYGVQDGDVLTHVDDKPVTSIEAGTALYENMDPNKRQVKVRIVRNNTPFFMQLEMDDFPNAPTPER